MAAAAVAAAAAAAAHPQARAPHIMDVIVINLQEGTAAEATPKGERVGVDACRTEGETCHPQSQLLHLPALLQRSLNTR